MQKGESAVTTIIENLKTSFVYSFKFTFGSKNVTGNEFMVANNPKVKKFTKIGQLEAEAGIKSEEINGSN